MRTAAKQRAEFLGLLQHSLDRACTFRQRTEKRYVSEFVRRLCKHQERINGNDYVFIDVPDGITKTPKLEHAVKGLYLLFGLVQHTVATHGNELIEKI